MNKLRHLLVFSLLFAIPVFSEVGTTSSIRGNVNVASAEITIKNTSTGVTKRVNPNDDGSFSASFLPVGGPYTLSASAAGYQSESVEGIFLILNDTTNISIDLLSTSSDLEEVVVTAQKREEKKT